MTKEETKTMEALAYLGFKVDKEVTSKELYYSYIGLSNRYNPETCTKPEYMDGEAYKKLNEYYNYLSSDICRTNETIRNIIDPANKTYEYQTEGPQIMEKPAHNECDPSAYNSNQQNTYNSFQDSTLVKDRPGVLNIILTILVPMYGIVNFFLIKRFMPKAAKWYLIIAIIAMILNYIILFYL